MKVEDICKNTYRDFTSWATALESATIDNRGATLEIPKSIITPTLESGFEKLASAFDREAGGDMCLRAGLSQDLVPSLVLGVNDVEAFGQRGNLRIGFEPHRTNFHPSSDTRLVGGIQQESFKNIHSDLTKGDEFHIEYGGYDKWHTKSHMGGSNVEMGIATGDGKTQIYTGASVSLDYENHSVLIGSNINYDTDHGFEHSILVKADREQTIGNKDFTVSGSYQRTEGGDRLGVSESFNVTVSSDKYDEQYKYVSASYFQHNEEHGNNVEAGLCQSFGGVASACLVVGHTDGELDSPGITAGGDTGLYGGIRLLDAKF